jgi:membrane protease YdiL (CAAX protease family)
VNAPTSAYEGPPPPVLDAPPKWGRRSSAGWWVHLLVIGAYPLTMGLLGGTGSGGRGPALTRGAQGLIVVCGVQLLIFAAILFVSLAASRASRDELLLRWRPGWWALPLGLGYSVALRLAVGLVALALAAFVIMSRLATPQELQGFVASNHPAVETVVDVPSLQSDPLYFWLTVTVVSFVLAGLREELWRSAFLAGLTALWPRRFGSRLGQVAAVAVGAALFGIGHLMQGWIAVGLTGLLGLGLGLIMVFHRSIWPAVIAHGFFNATSFALIPWILRNMPHLPPMGAG